MKVLLSNVFNQCIKDTRLSHNVKCPHECLTYWGQFIDEIASFYFDKI